MPKIQKNMRGVMYITIPTESAQLLKWTKGDKLAANCDPLRGELVFRKLA